MTIAPGLTYTVDLTVSESDTAIAFGSGDVPVLATPRVIALVEQAALEAVASELPDGTTTVGHSVQLEHLAPTKVGESVRAEAVLEAVAGRRLTFRVSASDDRGLIAAGRVTRVTVERQRFMEKAGG